MIDIDLIREYKVDETPRYTIYGYARGYPSYLSINEWLKANHLEPYTIREDDFHQLNPHVYIAVFILGLSKEQLLLFKLAFA
jgi:hypothetical protein